MADLLIRSVPEATHEELKRRADAAGLSLQAYVTRLLTAETSRPTIEEWFAELDELPPVDTSMTGAQAVEAARADLP